MQSRHAADAPLLAASPSARSWGQAVPRQAHPPGSRARHPLRGSVGSTGPTAGLDTHWDVCHPRARGTGTELGQALKHLHSTERNLQHIKF